MGIQTQEILPLSILLSILLVYNNHAKSMHLLLVGLIPYLLIGRLPAQDMHEDAHLQRPSLFHAPEEIYRSLELISLEGIEKDWNPSRVAISPDGETLAVELMGPIIEDKPFFSQSLAIVSREGLILDKVSLPASRATMGLGFLGDQVAVALAAQGRFDFTIPFGSRPDRGDHLRLYAIGGKPRAFLNHEAFRQLEIYLEGPCNFDIQGRAVMVYKYGDPIGPQAFVKPSGEFNDVPPPLEGKIRQVAHINDNQVVATVFDYSLWKVPIGPGKPLKLSGETMFDDPASLDRGSKIAVMAAQDNVDLNDDETIFGIAILDVSTGKILRKTTDVPNCPLIGIGSDGKGRIWTLGCREVLEQEYDGCWTLCIYNQKLNLLDETYVPRSTRPVMSQIRPEVYFVAKNTEGNVCLYRWRYHIEPVEAQRPEN